MQKRGGDKKPGSREKLNMVLSMRWEESREERLERWVATKALHSFVHQLKNLGIMQQNY